MVTAGEGASAPTASNYGVGGVGGKATRNQFRRSRATPYDRPPTARRNPSFLSKLVVDPIRNLASSAAHRLFASVTGKRLTPPPPPPLPPESIQEVGDGLGDAVIDNKAEAPEPLTVDGQNLATADTGGISELEQLLKQKTFTRSEIDRLTELLQSKAVDLPVVRDVKRAEASPSDPLANFEKPQFQKSPLAENGTLRERSRGIISTPGISTRVPEEDVASPAELAKAYMGSRPSKVSPSMLGLRSQVIREEVPLLSNASFTPKSPMISLGSKVNPRLELAENSSASIRSRGRSAIYNMARTPYSRVRSAFDKGSEPRKYGNGGYLLPSSSFQDQDGEPGSTKLALKRRSSVLDDDLGSGGPMRRIRQKHNLSSQRFNLTTSRGMGGASGALQQPLSLTQKLPLTDEWKYKGLKMVGENEDNGTPSTSYGHVPPKSSETAAKILQHLEKVTQREKSAESKLVTAREKSPTKLTTDMLHGQALRSLEDTNSPKLLQSTQGSQRSEDLSQSSLSRVRDFAFREQEKIEENGPKTISVQHGISNSVMNCNSAASVKDVVPRVDGSDSAVKLVSQCSQTKRAFMMSAHEDSLDLDEETYSNGPTSEAVVGGRGKSETSSTYHSSVSAEKVEDITTALPETKKSPPETIFGKKTDLEVRNATLVGGEMNGVAFPALHTSSTTSPSLTRPVSTSLFNEQKQENNKIPVSENSPVPSQVPSGPKPSFWTQPSPESLRSSSVVAPTLEVPGSDKHDNTKAVEGAEVKGKPENLRSSSSSPPSSTIASVGVPEKSSLKNGPLSISTSAVLPTPAVASTGFGSQTLTAGASPFSTSASVTNFAAATWSSGTSSSSPFGSAGTPVFQFGSSVSPSNAVSPSVSTPSDAVPSAGKIDTEREANTGSLRNTPFGGTSFAMASSGSSSFGLCSLSASATKSSSDSTASGFAFGAQSPDVGSGTATISQNAPFQFGSSASSPVFGSSGVSSFMSSNPVFSSSAPATKLFGSAASFGLSPSTSSVETKSAETGIGPSSVVFSFGTGASAASSGANAFGLSSGTSSTFSFGLSSSATSSLTNAVVSSSNTPPAVFSFGASSSSGTGMVSSSGTNAASSSSATPLSFGSSWQTPNSSPFGATSSSPPVFSFGASSSSFAAANTAPMVFGSSSAASSGVGFSFATASPTTSFSPSPFTSASIFGNSSSTLTTSGNNDHMSMEDSMAEDVQAASPAIPVFGQPPVPASPGGFAFGSAVPQSASPFQFGGQQGQGALQNSSPFQASGSMEFNAGGSFSLGSGGPGDKSNRRIVRVSKTGKHRKK